MDLRSDRALPPEARQEALFEAAESAGIFVGVRLCDEPLMTPVDFAADDAVDLAYVFVAELGLIAASQVRLALAGEPQKESSQQFLRDLLALGAQRVAATSSVLYRLTPQMALQTGKRGIFVFSFAGHGFFDQSGDLLVTQEFVARRPADTGLPFVKLMSDIAASVAPRRLVFLDACRTRLRSGRSYHEANDGGSSLEKAILASRGAAILAGATIGGSSYDDPERKNGVFTGAVIDILRGRIDVQASSPYLTLGNLAGAADESIRHWIALHREAQQGKSLGISSIFDPESMRALPLAVHPARLEEQRKFRRRCRDALAKLKNDLDAPLSGAVLDGIRHQLDAAASIGEVRLVIEAIERLDGSFDAREALLAIFEHRRQNGGGISGLRTNIRKKWAAALATVVIIAGFALSRLPRMTSPPENPEVKPAALEETRQSDAGKKNENLESAPLPAVGSKAALLDAVESTRGPTRSPEPPAEGGGTASFLHETLAQGDPQFLENFDATLAVGFSAELGVDVATIIWAPQGKEIDKKPAYSAGAEFTFLSSKGRVRLKILEIDWKNKLVRWSGQLLVPRLDCRTKVETFDHGPTGFGQIPTSRFGISGGTFQIQVTGPFSNDKRCLDCRIKAASYRTAVTVWSDGKAAGWGLYLLDMSEVRSEMYTLELDQQNHVAIRHYVDGRSPSTLWFGTVDKKGKIRLEMEAKENRLSAWADGKRLASLPLDPASIADVPLGTGFLVLSGKEAPATVFFDDYELTTCLLVGA